MGKREIHKGCCCESQKERDHVEDLDVVQKIILKWILDRMRWYGLD
jgi:hypothetical protein